MRDIITKLAAIFRGILTFIGVVFLGASIYFFVLPNTWGIIIGILFCLLGFYLARFVYITALRRGLFALSTATIATPDLDNLAPSSDSKTRKLSTQEYVDSFNKFNIRFRGGSLTIWGDFRGRDLPENHIIDKVTLRDSNTLEILFKSKNKLTIWNPGTVFESESFIKILTADRVKWEWYNSENKIPFYYDYRINGNKIKIDTDYDWKSYKIDTMIGDPAIFMYN